MAPNGDLPHGRLKQAYEARQMKQETSIPQQADCYSSCPVSDLVTWLLVELQTGSCLTVIERRAVKHECWLPQSGQCHFLMTLCA